MWTCLHGRRFFSNSTRRHKFFYRSQCVSSARGSAAAPPAAAAAEGGLFNSTNGFGSIRRPLSRLMGSHSLHGGAACFSGAWVRRGEGTDGRRSHLGPRRRPCQSRRRCTSACRAAGTEPGRRWFWSKTRWRRWPLPRWRLQVDNKSVSFGAKKKTKNETTTKKPKTRSLIIISKHWSCHTQKSKMTLRNKTHYD